MKVYVYPADTQGCGSYRLIWPGEVLRASGHDVEIVPPHETARRFSAKMLGDKMVDVNLPEDANVIVLQRITHHYLAQAIPLITKRGIAVVIDMDDDLTCIDRRHPANKLLDPASRNIHSWANAVQACDKATLVTVSTAPLTKTYARRHGRAIVLKNYVPRRFTEFDMREHKYAWGWAGAVASHPGDLQIMGDSIARMVEDRYNFHIVGPDHRVKETLGDTLYDSITVTGTIKHEHWIDEVSRLHVGVAPTAKTKFNRAKSWLKMLEYAAGGVPSVASDRPEYLELHNEYGIGNIATSPREWYDIVTNLMDDPIRHKEERDRDREIVRSRLTIEDNAHRWWDAWTRAYNLVNA